MVQESLIITCFVLRVIPPSGSSTPCHLSGKMVFSCTNLKIMALFLEIQTISACNISKCVKCFVVRVRGHNRLFQCPNRNVNRLQGYLSGKKIGQTKWKTRLENLILCERRRHPRRWLSAQSCKRLCRRDCRHPTSRNDSREQSEGKKPRVFSHHAAQKCKKKLYSWVS